MKGPRVNFHGKTEAALGHRSLSHVAPVHLAVSKSQSWATVVGYVLGM